jgi:hypothetical protein
LYGSRDRGLVARMSSGTRPRNRLRDRPHLPPRCLRGLPVALALALAVSTVACEGASVVGARALSSEADAGAPTGTAGHAGTGDAAADARAGDASADAPAGDDDGAVDGAPPSRATRSVGCDQPTDLVLGRYVKKDEIVFNVGAAYAATYTQRVYWVRLPKTYDPGRAYPTAFLGPGCGASGDSAIPLQEASKEDAILVGLNGINNCFNKDAADTPELPYFDETVARVEAEFCVDPSHLFVAGFSSGSWLTSYLGCVRADVIRAQGSSAGGLPPIPAACKGPIPAMFAADRDDNKNSPATVQKAIDRVRAVNGCGDETEPYDFGMPAPCVQYKGCKPGYPVVSCVTSGVGHADQSTTGISTYGFWHFWMSLN